MFNFLPLAIYLMHETVALAELCCIEAYIHYQEI